MPTTCRAQRLCQHSAICSRLSDCFAALCCCFVRRGRLVSSKRPTFIPGPAVCEICAGSRPPWAVPLVNHPQSFRLPSHDEASPCHAFPDHSRFPGASIDGPGPSTGLIVRQEPRYLAHPPPRSLPNGRHAVKSAHHSMMKPASPYLQTPRFHTTVQTLKAPVSTIASNQPKPCPCVDAPMYISRTSRYSPALYFMRTTTSARLSC